MASAAAPSPFAERKATLFRHRTSVHLAEKFESKNLIGVWLPGIGAFAWRTVMTAPTIRSTPLLSLTLALTALTLPACESGGHFTVLGYSSRPVYDTTIRTVFVPIFKNRTNRDSIRRGVEFDLTRLVIQEIESKTPYKVVSNRECADTELSGEVINIQKSLLNINQNNEIRQGETVMAVNVVWKDLRSGEVLSSRQKRPDQLLAAPSIAPPLATPGTGAAIDPNTLPNLMSPKDPTEKKADDPAPNPTTIYSVDAYVPEYGQSTKSALQGNMERLATQIVSMMEAPW